MKKLAIFLGGILALPAFAEVAPVFYDELTEYADAEYFDTVDMVPDQEAETVATTSTKAPVKISRQTNTSRNSANRGTTSRTTAATSARGTTGGNLGRTLTSRTAAATRGTTTARTTTSRTAGSRTAVSGRTTGTTRSATKGASPARVSVRSDVVSAAPASSATNSVKYTSITGSGATLYNPTDSRVSVRGAGTSQRSPGIRVATTTASTNDGIVTSTSDMDELAELTDYCKAQYAACMDNYCNVLDDNQGRCSCSANLKNYAKAEATLKSATEELQNVAQKIQYIGLSGREVETLFSQTEAELSMQNKTDNSQLKTSLDKIKNMIIDVKSGTSSSNSTSGINFDLSGLLEFSIDSTGFDLSSFLGNFSNNASEVTNQRGVELYKTATNRCKASVLRSCTAQGVDASLVTNAYDLEIDKECIAYERSLNDSNSQMTATVRNAQSVLQKARLLVAQSKNQYGTMRECISALDSCMQDEFVCGSDYENCLDPTGRYIVNGAIVVGSQPGHAIDPGNQQSAVMSSDVCSVNLYRTWDFPNTTCTSLDAYDIRSVQNNAWGAGSTDTLADYIDATVTGAVTRSDVNMSKYLQNKIGYVDNDANNYGMCISVLNKCQDYTYDGRGTNAKYNPKNDVIKQYLARILIQIKSKQDEILADYAANCIADVNSCLAQNNYPSDEPMTTGANDELVSNWNNAERTQANIAVNACRSQIVTCMSTNGYSIENPTPTEMACWVMGLQFNTITSECENYGNYTIPNGGENNNTTFTVNYNFNGGTCSTSSATGSTTSPVTLPGKSDCSKQNNTLSGWKCGNDTTPRNPGTSYSPTDHVTCIAQWSENPSTTHSITWHTEKAGVSVPSSCPSTYTESTGNQNKPCSLATVNGWTFTGWCTTATGGGVCSDQSTPTVAIVPAGSHSDINFYAQWTSSTTYTLEYNCGTGCTGSALNGQTTVSSGANVNLDTSCANTEAGESISLWQCTNGVQLSGRNIAVITNNTTCTATCTKDNSPTSPTETGPGGGAIDKDTSGDVTEIGSDEQNSN